MIGGEEGFGKLSGVYGNRFEGRGRKGNYWMKRLFPALDIKISTIFPNFFLERAQKTVTIPNDSSFVSPV